jgi:hypothetical protein
VKEQGFTNSANFLNTVRVEIEFLMPNVPNESAQNLDSPLTSASSEVKGKFNREVRLSKNSCPLCNFVHLEIEKGNPIPIEEWIYLTHLRNVHGIEP